MLLQGIRLILSIYFSKFILLVSLWRHTGGTYHRLRIQIPGPLVLSFDRDRWSRLEWVLLLSRWSQCFNFAPKCCLHVPSNGPGPTWMPRRRYNRRITAPHNQPRPEYCQWVPTMKSFLPASPVCQWERLTATASNLLRKIFRNSIIKNKIIANNNIYLFLFPSG